MQHGVSFTASCPSDSDDESNDGSDDEKGSGSDDEGGNGSDSILSTFE